MTTTYVDYTYYQATYLGTSIASADFARLALRASAVIDYITFQRATPIVTAATDTATIDLIKMATCSVAEELQTEEAGGNADGIQSESIGNNSVSYAVNSAKMLTNEARQSKAASLYLASTPLMFRGFATDEYGSV